MNGVKFEIIIYDGIDDLDAFGVLEALTWASYSVQFKGLRKQDFISTTAGVKIIPSGTFDLQNPPDVLIVPGGGWLIGGSPDEFGRATVGASAEANKGDILE